MFGFAAAVIDSPTCLLFEHEKIVFQKHIHYTCAILKKIKKR